MATKRPSSSIHPSRADLVPADAPPRKKSKPTPPDHGGTKSFKKAHPVNALKTNLRNLRRQLQAPQNLPPKLRITKERALASAEYELKAAQEAEKKSKMIARYHKIRFFDRQKATKRLKRAKKVLRGEDGGEREERGREVDECEVDLNYALFYPLERAYVALYPTRRRKDGEDDGGDGEGVEQERQGDPKMREVVRKCMREGTLESLRHGRLDEEGNVKRREEAEEAGEKVSRTEKDGKSKKRKAAEVEVEAEASDGESDGGFFE